MPRLKVEKILLRALELELIPVPLFQDQDIRERFQFQHKERTSIPTSPEGIRVVQKYQQREN